MYREQSLKQKIRQSRFWLSRQILKITSPHYYNFINKISKTQDIPRPTIKFMKKHFDNRFLCGVEIGVNQGSNSDSILKELNINYLGLIDIWDTYTQSNELHDYKILYKWIREKYKDKNNVVIIKNDSVVASHLFRDNSLDFCYIDANHDEEFVYKDLTAWFNKIRIGGVIGGHDYPYNEGVLNAVNKFCIEKNQVFNAEFPDFYFVKSE